MKITIPISLGVLHVWAAHGAKAEGGFLSLPLTRQIASSPTSASSAIGPDSIGYLVDVDVGTPKQRLQLAVDIGGYGARVVGFCGRHRNTDSECEKRGAYTASLSSTSVYVAEGGYVPEEDSNPRYWEDGYYYYADDLTIAAQGTLDNVTFFAWNSSKAYKHGYLGLGPGNRGSNPYATGILDGLASQGLIESRAFGVTFDGSLDAESLVLGGVDSKKFSGALARVPVVDAPPEATPWEQDKYWLSVNSATLDSGNGSRTAVDGFTVIAQGDMVNTLLPIDIVEPMLEALSLDWPYGNWRVVPCSRKDEVNGSLELEFSGFTASIAYADLLAPRMGPDAKEGECYITVEPWDYKGRTPWRLGSAFLRSVYAVFDQDNEAVWLAKRADCGSELVAFSKGEDVRGQCDGSESGETSSGGGGSPNNDGSGSGGSQLGVGVGLMLGAAFLSFIL